MAASTHRRIVYVVLSLLLAACGDAPAPEIEVPSWAKVAPEQIAEAKKHGVPVAFENDLGMRFVLIPAGTFLMGSPEDEEGRLDDETQHEVTITKPYYMSIYEVTNGQYRSKEPGHPKGRPGEGVLRTLVIGEWDTGLRVDQPLQPVVHVECEDAEAFAKWLSRSDGKRTYRLPTEAEWERAARAGSDDAPFPWGESIEEAYKHANLIDLETMQALDRGSPGFPGDDGHRVSAPVGSYTPNGYGLHDVLGNVAEWCRDWLATYPTGPVTDPIGPATTAAPLHSVLVYPDGRRMSETQRIEVTARVLRGGSWAPYPYRARLALRGCGARGNAAVGFRLVSPLPEPGEK